MFALSLIFRGHSVANANPMIVKGHPWNQFHSRHVTGDAICRFARAARLLKVRGMAFPAVLDLDFSSSGMDVRVSIMAGCALHNIAGVEIAATLQQSNRLKADKGIWIILKSRWCHFLGHPVTLSAHRYFFACGPTMPDGLFGFSQIAVLSS